MLITKYLIALIYVLTLGIGLPRTLVRRFPNSKKWKLISGTFFLLLLSSIPGAFIIVIYYNGLDYFLAISSDLIYLVASSIGFSCFHPWPPFGLGWLAALVSLFSFFFIYKARAPKIAVKKPNHESEIITNLANAQQGQFESQTKNSRTKAINSLEHRSILER